ncbi:MAG TPA: hypothetical protein PLG34_01080 [Spirochaetota bacterium]|jgi:hypothetical protein|nr:MAG: hypothetical protein BWX91_00736 [Spirochaetes bacterium ADurb.Bin133]HNZ26122.1 hypothetical protein [Spirochaetota bacterium]HPY86561.1 hypothetical protein [Spirochaetota bacterium]HQB60833.1 hypothetical protein [Spirochaetota bacterium]
MKNFFILFFLFTAIILNSLKYDNPNWEFGIRYKKLAGVSDYLFAPTSLDFRLESGFEYVDGMRFGFVYDTSIGIKLSKLFNFDFGLKHTRNGLEPDVFRAGWEMNPVFFMSVEIYYIYRDFNDFKIGESNIVVLTNFYVDLIKWVDFSIKTGAAFQFVDLNIFDQKITYKEDFLFQFFFLFDIEIAFNPAKFYTFAFRFGNRDDMEIFSSNYLQFEYKNRFYMPKNISFNFDIGYGVAGALPFAGYINKFWIKSGIGYELDF